MFAVFGLGPTELLVLAALGVLLFGNRLPEVARSLGKTAAEFKKGMGGIEEDLSNSLK